MLESGEMEVNGGKTVYKQPELIEKRVKYWIFEWRQTKKSETMRNQRRLQYFDGSTVTIGNIFTYNCGEFKITNLLINNVNLITKRW